MNPSEKNTERKARLWGVLAVVLSACAILCVLVFCGLYRPFPPPPEYGMEVNLGYSDDGTGDNQMLDPQSATASVTPQQPTVEEDDLLEAPDDEAPAIVEPKPKKPKPQPKPKPKPKPEPKPVPEPEPEQEVVPEEPRQPVLNPLATYKGKRKGTDNSMQGETGQPGDQGKPTGDPAAKGYSGVGGTGGSGIEFSLEGRTLTTLKKPEYNSDEEGVVVVRIWVNPQGRVTRVQAGVKGTTTMDQNLWQTAEYAARNSAFAPKEYAPEEQVGTISYRFVRRQ